MVVVERLDPTDEQPSKSSPSVSEKEPPPPGTEDDVIDIPVPSSLNSLVTTSSAIDDEFEEGEIEEDEDERALEYEDISSDEEVNIRERIAQLEAMEDELRKIEQISADGAHFAHGKPAVIDVRKNADYECILDDGQYLRRYKSVPKPKPLPVRRRKLRPQRVGSQRSVRSSSARRRHGESKRRTLEKRKREQSFSARKNDVHRTRHKRQRQHSGPPLINIANTSDSEEDFPLDRARLQAACNINAGKRKTDKENWDALKQKLKLSMEKRKHKQSETSKEVEIIADEPMVLVDDDDEEDEEVMQLRLQALKSKREVKESDVISLLEDPITPETVADEQTLRMIALRSAFTKKHEIRQKKKQGERPYSPSDELFLYSSPIEDEEDDDEVQIIETRFETVEIPDSSSDVENRMEISPEPQCPDPPEISQAVDMELATSGESRSPMPLDASHKPVTEAKDDIPELEPPPPPVISEDQQSELPEEDDEESLRHQLLSSRRVGVTKQIPAPIANRPLTPVSEEETDALRDVILSGMSKKSNKQTSTVETAPLLSRPKETDTADIPKDKKYNDPVKVPCTMEPLTISINNVYNLPVLPEQSQMPSPALSLMVPSNQSKVQSHPNLITLTGRQKVIRKKRKKSGSAPTVSQAPAQMALRQVPENNQVLAIAVPRPSRTLIKIPAVQKPSASLPATPKIMVTSKKLVNNPNKLINLNARLPSVAVPSPQERPNVYVQQPVARMVVQVGYSDSDSDPAYYPDPDPVPDPAIDQAVEKHLQGTFLRDMDSPSRVMLESPTFSPSPAPLTPTSATETTDTNDSLPEANPNPPTVAASPANDAAFEQRLDQYLRTVRSKIDQSKAAADAIAAAVEAENQVKTIVTHSPTAGSGSVGRDMAVSKATRKPIIAPAAPITPLAVRHLPKSAQLEYRRLVARMALLEKQKQQRVQTHPRPPPIALPSQPAPPLSGPPHPLTKTIINTGPGETEESKIHDIVVTVNHDGRDVVSLNSHSLQQPPKRTSESLVKRVLINNTVIAERETNVQVVTPPAVATNEEQPPPTSTTDMTNSATESRPVKIRNTLTSPRGNENPDIEVTSLREALKRLPLLRGEDRRKVLTIAEHRFKKHSHKFTQELQDLIGTVENAQMERQKQYDLENKVAFLKEKLTVLERALSLHKKRLDVIFPALQESHAKVMASRKRSIELNNICLAVGRETQGPSYSPPSTTGNEIHEQLKLLTKETKQLKEMKRLSLDEFKQLTADQRRMQHEKQKHEIEEQLVKSGTPEPEDQLPLPSMEPSIVNDESQPMDITEETVKPQQTTPDTTEDHRQYAKSAPTSRSVSPLGVTVPEQAQEAPAALTSDNKSQFRQYTSPLVSLKDQSALNIPDGVICPYQMRGECIDQDCKFDHFK